MAGNDLAWSCAALPVFPLPRTVLMQGAMLPLHVFEPRYRALVAHQPFPDGRSNIVLRYVGRVRIVEELPSAHPFRIVRGEPVEDDPHGAVQALASLRLLVLQFAAHGPAAAAEVRRLVQLEGMDLVDALARRIIDEPNAQRAYLGAVRSVDRIDLVQQRLADFMLPGPSAGTA